MLKRARQILSEKKLLSWQTLLLGYRRRFATRDDVIEYSIEELERLSTPPLELSLLAGGENLNEDDFIGAMQKLSNSGDEKEEDVLDKWRLALLINLQLSEKSDKEKIEVLQEIYAEFEYPDDMERCSIYYMNQSERNDSWKVGDRLNNDPYREMLAVIELLEKKLQRLHETRRVRL